MEPSIDLTEIANKLSNDDFLVDQKTAYNIILQQLQANSSADSESSLAQVALDATIEMLKTSIVFDIASIQPMSAPVGLAYYMSYTSEKTPKTMPETSMAINLQVKNAPIEAKTRKIGFSYNAQQVPVNFESIIVDGISDLYEEMIINGIMQSIDVIHEPGPSSLNPIACMLSINRQANIIARDTRRGAGNIIILTHEMLDYFYDVTQSSPVNIELNDTGKRVLRMFKSSGVRKSACVGTMQSYKVLVSKHIGDEERAAVIMYKGNTVADAAAIFAPYVLVNAPAPYKDSNSNRMQAVFYSRAGEYFLPNSPQYCKKIVFSS